MTICPFVSDSFANPGAMALTRVARSSTPMPEVEPVTYAMREPPVRTAVPVDNA